METAAPSILVKLAEATSEVFEKMVCTALGSCPPVVDGFQPPAHVMGAVRFLGTLSGTVSFYASDDASRRIAGHLLGIRPDEAGDSVADAVGEITNMIAGTFRAKMTQSGETLMITTPTVTRGSDFSAQHFNVASRSLCRFTMGDHEVFVELILQSP